MNREALQQSIDRRLLANKSASVARQFITWLLRPHPSLRDELSQRRSQMLAGMLLITMTAGIAGLGWQFVRVGLLKTASLKSIQDLDFITLCGALLIVLVALLTNRSGHVQRAAQIFISVMIVAFAVAPFTPDALRELLFFLIVPIVVTAIFFSVRATFLLAAVVTVAVTGLNIITGSDPTLGSTLFLIIASGTILVFIKHLQFQEGLRAQELEHINQRLRASEESLEQRVQERTRDLEIAADVSLQITTVLDRVQLLAEVAERTAHAFDLYHVSIFLYDAGEQIIRLRQGVGHLGEQMLAQGKQFQMGDAGLVPQAARTLRVQLSNDVEQDSRYQPNPLLPETRAELAIPIVYQARLLGVLDLQSQIANRFSDDETRIMKTLADQIAIAVRNSQLFEESTAALAQAERANRVKSAFLASMSHELRTPLNAIINFTKFVAKGSMGPVNAEQSETLNEVIDSAKHLLNLINDVLDMSKIEAGSLKLFVEPNVDLDAILKTVTSTGRTLLAGKPVALQTDVQDGLPTITGDRQRILQILLNILSNACKFTEQGAINIRAYEAVEDVIIAIEDTGPGIAPGDQSLVFEAFKQTSTGLRQGGGTGLGMPISRSLAEAHGGRLWLTSEPGKGSIFYVALPIKSESLELSVAALTTRPAYDD